MEPIWQALQARKKTIRNIAGTYDSDQYEPVLFRLSREDDQQALEKLLKEQDDIWVHDTLYAQLKELIKIKHPDELLDEKQIADLIHTHTHGIPLDNYGVWVYYPWKRKLLHILDEEEFIAVRTNRNLYKITPEEQKLLSGKKIGIIGLSVGQSVALTLAMERSFGELRIADFDCLEITNLNRLRTSLCNLGLKKTVIVAREIKEIDPYLDVVCYHEGLHPHNLEDFLLQGGKLDILVDECDSVQMKILSRWEARALGIPVVMETSDRGLIDVERFDIEKNRPIFHGLIDEARLKEQDLTQMTAQQRMNMVMKIVDHDKLSARMKASLAEIGKTIQTWPQLASAVFAGGAHLAALIRMILLGAPISSCREYFDVEDKWMNKLKESQLYNL